MNNKSNEENKNSKEERKTFIKQILVVIILAFFIRTFIFNVTYVSGDSMNPTLSHKDRLIVKKYESVLNIEEYARGDVVVFKSPLEKDNRTFIKRVIGVPGDKINILDGKIFINDDYIEEGYIEEDSFTESLTYGENYIVPESEVFVIGDNRLPGGSNDSRRFGSISVNEIKGRAVFRIFPFDKIGKDF